MRAHRQSSRATVRREKESQRREEEQKYFHIDVKRRDETNRDSGKMLTEQNLQEILGLGLKMLGICPLLGSVLLN